MSSRVVNSTINERILLMKFDELHTPVYVIDEKQLIDNLTILSNIEKRTGCHILLAQKAFSAYSVRSLS
mgnify:FL=1